MIRILRDEDGNIFKATVVSGIPSEFEDITDIMQKDQSLDEIDEQYLEAIEVPAVEYVAPVEAVEAVEAQPEKWTKEGEEDLFEDPEDETYTHEPALPAIEGVEAVEEVEAVARYFVIQKKADGDKDRRNKILDDLRALRAPLLVDADIEINKIEDVGGDSAAMRAYRQELRDVPAAYIKVDGDPKVATDSIDLENFNWPAKPE